MNDDKKDQRSSSQPLLSQDDTGSSDVNSNPQKKPPSTLSLPANGQSKDQVLVVSVIQ
jgi:hypothetical protein